jgi:hypothetical protein
MDQFLSWTRTNVHCLSFAHALIIVLAISFIAWLTISDTSVKATIHTVTTIFVGIWWLLSYSGYCKPAGFT